MPRKHEYFDESLRFCGKTCPEVDPLYERTEELIAAAAISAAEIERDLGFIRMGIGRRIALELRRPPTLRVRIAAFLQPFDHEDRVEGTLRSLDECIERAAKLRRSLSDEAEDGIAAALTSYQNAEFCSRQSLRQGLCDAIEEGKLELDGARDEIGRLEGSH